MMTPAQLRKKRLAIGLTQEQLAARLGVTRRTIIKWEGVGSKVPVWTALALWALAHKPN